MLGLNGEEASKNMLCSEFAAKATLTAFVELNDWIEKRREKSPEHSYRE